MSSELDGKQTPPKNPKHLSPKQVGFFMGTAAAGIGVMVRQTLFGNQDPSITTSVLWGAGLGLACSLIGLGLGSLVEMLSSSGDKD
jgi:hypothetical protein